MAVVTGASSQDDEAKEHEPARKARLRRRGRHSRSNDEHGGSADGAGRVVAFR
jgi:hypothetical protein